MLSTLKHEQSEMMLSLIAAILVIGFVYWLLIKGEDRQR
jgi:flagellar biogenesis protein FliO